MKNLTNSWILAAAFFIFYVLINFVFVKRLDALGTYASYIFEACFIIILLAIYKSHFRFKFKIKKLFLLQVVAAFACGFAVYNGAGFLNVLVPFDLSDHETQLFLILLGPVLEELLFRQVLWSTLEIALKSRRAAFVLTSLIFTFAHFFAYFYVPESIKPFVIYQTAYVLLIALWWGAIIYRFGVITMTVWLHIAFNTGFFVAFAFKN
jgi:membrane protease YdiL (CAAX protease family)